MRIVLIGTVIKDKIIGYDGTTSSSLGGLLYSINAMRSVAAEDDTIIPVSAVGSDIYDQIIEYLKTDHRIETKGLYRKAQKNNRVKLRYTSPFERIEQSVHPFAELTFKEIKPFLTSDLVIVNMISGWEISLRTFRKLREHCKGLIYFDFHSLALGRAKNGTRYYRAFPDADKWIELCDILQLNEHEFDIINTNKSKPVSFFKRHCLKEDKIINLTKSERGSISFFSEQQRLRAYDAFPPETLPVNDPTGCGDAFAAGFIIHYLNTSDIRAAARHANTIAAIFGQYRGLPDPEKVRETYLTYAMKDV